MSRSVRPPSFRSLRERLDASIERQDAGLALDAHALVEATDVLDLAFRPIRERVKASAVDVQGVLNVALLHMIRGLNGSDRAQVRADGDAATALYVVVHLVQPEMVAPQVRDGVTRALAEGAPQRLDGAAVWAVEYHSVVLREVWDRVQGRPLADAYLKSRQLAVALAPAGIPGMDGLLKELAEAHVLHYDQSGALNDLDAAAAALEQALAITDDPERATMLKLALTAVQNARPTSSGQR